MRPSRFPFLCFSRLPFAAVDAARAGLWGAGLLILFLSRLEAAGRLVPEPLPDPKIVGFTFPESEATITTWVTGAAREPGATAWQNLHRHGWGLWAAVTSETNQISERQRLRVFETWITPDELAAPIAPPSAFTAVVPAVTAARSLLRPLDQLQSATQGAVALRPMLDAESRRIVGFVKFDPTAADHIRRQSLLQRAALDALLAGGAQNVPVFPSSALALKSIFQVIKAKDLVAGRYYRMKAWGGPPATPQAWDPARWPGSVWIDVRDGGAGQGAVDSWGAIDGSTRTEETTYPVSNFINYRLSAADAAALNRDAGNVDASAGDYAILVAMHIAGREIARWTWQTFWWTPAPDALPAPSSATIALLRPTQLQGAARHYAMALCYSMQAPEQPYVGGENAGASVYAYNPWLEARFGPADLPDSSAGRDPLDQPAANNCGVQSNCMSCHARANYNPARVATAPRYSGARYVDLSDPQFAGTLQVDFLWSLAASAR